MTIEFTDADLESYLDETLDADEAAKIEQALRCDKKLLARLSRINGRRDAGIHSLADIWRRAQIGVPTIDEVAKYLLGVLTPEKAGYIRFRVETLRCRYTIAMIRDLENQKSMAAKIQNASRRKKYFDSSAGLLRRKKGN
jgi:hypothetical protein